MHYFCVLYSVFNVQFFISILNTHKSESNLIQFWWKLILVFGQSPPEFYTSYRLFQCLHIDRFWNMGIHTGCQGMLNILGKCIGRPSSDVFPLPVAGTSFGFPASCSSNDVIPVIAFIGVRISWDRFAGTRKIRVHAALSILFKT